MTTPLVSIIIPTYNRAHLIGETLDSIIAQTYTNWECIVVDDGSTDNTDKLLAEYCKKDARFKYHHRPKNRLKGGNAARNYGFELSKGEYLIFLDSDDLLEESCIKERCRLIPTISDIKDELLIFNMGLLIKESKTDRIFNKDYKSTQTYLKYFFCGTPPWTISCVFWNKETFVKVGKFDVNFTRLQDVDLHTRLLLNGIKINKVEITDSWYRILDDLSDYTSKERLPKIIKSYILYINKYFNYSEEIKIEMTVEEVNNHLKLLFLYVLKKNVFKKELVCFNEMMLLNKKNKIIKDYRLTWIKLLASYYKMNLQNKKGTGYDTIRNKAFN